MQLCPCTKVSVGGGGGVGAWHTVVLLLLPWISMVVRDSRW
jgi:hypothetical protein